MIEGDAVPALFIPLLVQLYKQGKFPIDKLIARYPLADINGPSPIRRPAR